MYVFISFSCFSSFCYIWFLHVLPFLVTIKQAPEKYFRMYDHIDDEDRRGHLAMTTHLDDGLSRVVRALEDNNMVDNTLLVLIADVSQHAHTFANIAGTHC